jgi:hypothetical protein
MATEDFRSTDVVVGRSVMTGKNTRGRTATGVVLNVLPGIGFHIDNGTQRSMLWRQLRLHRDCSCSICTGLPAQLQQERARFPLVPSVLYLRRTDSGMDDGSLGFPDCAFWERNGIQALYVALPADYERGGESGGEQDIMTLLQSYRDTAPADGPYRRALDAQILSWTV